MGQTGFGWLRIGSVAGFCKHGNEPSISIKKAGYCLTSSVTISFSKTILHRGLSITYTGHTVQIMKQSILVRTAVSLASQLFRIKLQLPAGVLLSISQRTQHRSSNSA
jgi:hypothetical protein